MPRHLLPLLAAALIALSALIAAPAVAQTSITLTEGEGRAINLPDGAVSVFVADPAVVDVQAPEPGVIYITGTLPGQTNIIVRDQLSQTLTSLAVIVRHDTAQAELLLDEGLSLGQTNTAVIIRGDTNTVAGARSVARARNLLEQQGKPVVDKSSYDGPNQVSLRVRFVEASRSDLRRVGIDLSALGRSSAGPLRVVTGLGDPTGFLNGGAFPNPGAGGRLTAGGLTIDALIDALESRGLVQILSEPTLTTVSGQTASFRAGGEFAYPVNQGDGVITAAFKEYGVSIDFTPVILPGDRIAIHVTPEVSFLDKTNSVAVQGFTVPGVSVRRADTTVEVGSGQSFAIAGLYEQFSESTSQGVPGLSRLLGHNSRIRQERELMIFITPYLSDATNVTQPKPRRKPSSAMVGFITR